VLPKFVYSLWIREIKYFARNCFEKASGFAAGIGIALNVQQNETINAPQLLPALPEQLRSM
jgi:hypothetical protein